MPWQKLNPDAVRVIIELYRNGADRLDLARDYGVSLALIDHHLRKEFGPRGRGKLSADDRVEIVTRFKRGEIAADLAREFGVGFSAVSKLIRKRPAVLSGAFEERMRSGYRRIRSNFPIWQR